MEPWNASMKPLSINLGLHVDALIALRIDLRGLHFLEPLCTCRAPPLIRDGHLGRKNDWEAHS